MLYKRVIVVWTLMLIGVAPCLADDCDKETDQLGLTQCHANALKAAEDPLQGLVAQYRARLEGRQLALFDQEQAAWLSYRNSYCEFRSSSSEGGSVHGMVVAMCREGMTTARLEDIRKLTSTGAEGDLSHPVVSPAPAE